MTDIHLAADGPHSPDYTREVAGALAEAVRVCNYATLGDAPGLEYPGDVYDLIGYLYTATGRLPQLFGQLAAFLRSQAAAGRIGDSYDRDPAALAAKAGVCLGEAHTLADGLTAELRAAQNAISGLYAKGDDDA